VTNKRRLTKEEQETGIRSSAADQEWDVCTADPRMIRYLTRRGWTLQPDYQDSTFLFCRLPFAKLRVLRPEKRKGRQRPAFSELASPDNAGSMAGEVKTTL
jgi:hypothetical protein